MAALFSVPGARLGQRIGMAPVGVLGTLLFAASGVWWVTQVGEQPDYAAAFLPGMLVGGAGVGLVIPTLTAAATAALPPARIATGTAVVTMARQLGLAVGVAVLIALVGTPETVADFEPAWTFILVTALLSGITLTGLGRVGVRAPTPVAA
jgi:MFS family permease